jgi:hypothetical protein
MSALTQSGHLGIGDHDRRRAIVACSKWGQRPQLDDWIITVGPNRRCRDGNEDYGGRVVRRVTAL